MKQNILLLRLTSTLRMPSESESVATNLRPTHDGEASNDESAHNGFRALKLVLFCLGILLLVGAVTSTLNLIISLNSKPENSPDSVTMPDPNTVAPVAPPSASYDVPPPLPCEPSQLPTYLQVNFGDDSASIQISVRDEKARMWGNWRRFAADQQRGNHNQWGTCLPREQDLPLSLEGGKGGGLRSFIGVFEGNTLFAY